ncbi:DUF485 domain-containing protein [Georgenia sp. TF02-10]|uniref:DUF485 domain-containing protein n=1 Tax=Georgenia sp. TF02-10 TaxID=2917725 RepID=UPI001FA768AA|nr:DUF485 domain-containing protein [Georgenia sp. TF02-10]UNX53673.1 DUF485 domain-containing protein [Georgenia sp. TF02-10]
MSHDPEAHLPPRHDPLPAISDEDGPGPSAEEFARVQQSAEFQQLRSRFRRFAFPMTVAFLVWYFAYVLLSTFAEDLMSVPVIGYLNVGLLLGLGQFVTTFLITWLYVRHANRNLDPVAGRLRAELEGEA